MRGTISPPTTDRTTAAAAPPTAGRNPLPAPFVVLVDQRESAPFHFRGLRAGSRHQYRPLIIPTRHLHLPTGDYSIAVTDDAGRITRDFRDELTVERKSLPDLFSSLAGAGGERRDRFRREHERMQSIVRLGGFAHVVIEASRDDARNNPPEYGAHPSSVLACSVSWPRRFGVQWHWAGSRDEAERLTWELLYDGWRVLTGQVGQEESNNQTSETNEGAK